MRSLVILAGIGWFLWDLVSPNPLLSGYASGIGVLLAWVLYRKQLPVILVLSVAYQWLQASALIWSSNFEGQPITVAGFRELSGSANVVGATWLTLTGLVAVTVGLRFGSGRPVDVNANVIEGRFRHDVDLYRLFILDLSAILLSHLFNAIGGAIPGLSEPIRALLMLRWGIYYFLAYTVFLEDRGKWLLATVSTIEVVIGFSGYFSDFKTVFIVAGAAVLAQPNPLSQRNIGRIVGAFCLMLAAGLAWSSVKIEYRQFLDRGTGGQEILVGWSDRIKELGTLMLDIDAEKLGDAFQSLVNRISYVEYFGGALETVPAAIPFQDGKLWGEAIEHVLDPRILDPGKQAINDSDRTRTYSGFEVRSGEYGTSISIGYVGESYIDFGPVFMFPLLFLVGIGIGRGYAVLLRKDGSLPIVTGSVVGLVVENFFTLEVSNLKLVGSLTTGFLVLYLAREIFVDPLENLCKKDPRGARRAGV